MAENDTPPVTEDQMNPALSSNDQVLNNTNTNACVTVGPSTPNKSLPNESEKVSNPAQCAETM